MLKLFSQKPKRNSAISLDIGTEFIKALIFEVEDGKGKIVGQGRERQRLSDMQGGGVTDIGGVIHTAQKALQEAADQAGYLPEQVIIGIAGELVKGNTTTSIINRKKPNEPISYQELKDIISQAQKETLLKSRKDLSWETGYAEIDVQLVNSAVVSVKIDGYHVSNPISFQGRQVEVNIYTAYAPIVHLGALQTIVEALNLDLLTIATEPYAVARCFGAEESGDVSSIFIDVGGGTTDIAVVRSGGLEGTKMFALGGRVISKRIANSLKISFAEAEKIKLAYASNNLEPKDMLRVSAFIENDVNVWLSGVELALEEFTTSERFQDNKLLPSRIYLCGGGSLLPELKKLLEHKPWTKILPFSKQPEILFIKPNQVSNIIDETNALSTTQDVTPMALANVALDLIGDNGPLDVAVSKILKSLRA